MVGASLLGACTPDGTSSAPSCQLANATYGDLTIGSYTPPPRSTRVTVTPDPASPGAPPPAEPANVRVDISVSANGVDLQFSGDGPVEWSSRTIAMAYDPKGGPLTVSGDGCIVQLDLWGVTASDSLGTERTIGRPGDPIAEVVRLPRRDDLTQVFIGLRRQSGTIDVHTDDGTDPSLRITQ